MRILIADDHALLSESLRMMLEKDEETEVVGVAYNGAQAVKMCGEQNPDVVLMDVSMPDMNGITATRKIKQAYPNTKVLMLTSFEDAKWIADSFEAGADGYLMKDTPPDKLITLLRCVNWGYVVSSHAAIQTMIDAARYAAEVTGSSLIKDEELQIIKLISEGRSNSEIAETMNYAVGTVKNKITKIIELSGVENRAQLVLYALKNNLI